VQTKLPTANSYPGFDDWFLPELAYANGEGAAKAPKNYQHYYHNFNFSIPTGAIINGIEVRLDAWYNTLGWNPSSAGYFRTWVPFNSSTFANSSNVTSSEATYYVGGPTSTWGRTWNPVDFSNTNFKIQLLAYTTFSNGTQYSQSLSLDYCQVTVYYTPPPPSEPTVTTAAITGLTSTTASSGGTVTSDGGAPVTARGVCWSTSANPTISDTCTNDGPGTGPFVSSISGLTPATTYHVRAYATNSVGTGYGNDLVTVMSGDLNNDTTVNVFDALLTLQYAVGLIEHNTENNAKYLAAGDVSPLDANGKPKGDGQVNVFDALAILRHAVGLDVW